MLRFLNPCLVLSLIVLLNSCIIASAEWDGDATLNWTFNDQREGGRYEMMFFKKGDTLTIEWSGTHNVFRHRKDNCDVTDRVEIAPSTTGGTVQYTFEEIGHHYLACDEGIFDTGNNEWSHCAVGGMYVHAHVCFHWERILAWLGYIFSFTLYKSPCLYFS